MTRSAGLRFIVVGALAFLMFLPLNLVSDIVQERANYSDQTISSLSNEWGGKHLFSGPLLEIPVTEEVTYDRRREAVDALTGLTLRDEKGNPIFEHFEETVTERRPSIYLYPRDLDIDVASESATRSRGLFEVPVYSAAVSMAFDFDAEAAENVVRGKEVVHWDEATLSIFLTSNRGLRGEARLTADGRDLSLEPVSGGETARTGITTNLGDPRDIGAFSLALAVNGAETLAVAATGRTTRFSLTSDWPDPSFFGTFLPDAREITEEGFTASWTVPHLARSLPQVGRTHPDEVARQRATMGARFITPNDFYQKAWRASRYGILFISLTFLTILLLDRTSARPAHPVQYLMVGLAQSVFILLMVSYAEQIGFGAAYLVAAGATIGLLVLFGATALKLGKRTGLLGGALVTVYGVLYLTLRSADHALLAGSTLAFAALALTMWLTRNETWHGPERSGGWPFRKGKKPEASAV
jgi:inner membrane protein